jgi:hypothetical protein
MKEASAVFAATTAIKMMQVRGVYVPRGARRKGRNLRERAWAPGLRKWEGRGEILKILNLNRNINFQIDRSWPRPFTAMAWRRLTPWS